MKNIMIVSAAFVLAACSNSSPPPQAPLDMQAVAQYQAEVARAKPLTAAQQKAAATQAVEMPLNASDNRVTRRQSQPGIILSPSIGYYHGFGGHRHRGYGGLYGYPGYW